MTEGTDRRKNEESPVKLGDLYRKNRGRDNALCIQLKKIGDLVLATNIVAFAVERASAVNLDYVDIELGSFDLGIHTRVRKSLDLEDHSNTTILRRSLLIIHAILMTYSAKGGVPDADKANAVLVDLANAHGLREIRYLLNHESGWDIEFYVGNDIRVHSLRLIFDKPE